MSSHMLRAHRYVYVSTLVSLWVEKEAGLSDSTNKGVPLPLMYTRSERIISTETTNRKPRLNSAAKLLPANGDLNDNFQNEMEKGGPLLKATVVKSLKLILAAMKVSYAKHTPSTVTPCSLLRRERIERVMVRMNLRAELSEEGDILFLCFSSSCWYESSDRRKNNAESNSVLPTMLATCKMT